jgi:CRP-like cAMP-binding protein
MRHIMAYLVPGDFCDLHVLILKAMDHNIGTLSACSVVKISARRILEMTERPALARALWWATLVDEAVLREWLVNIGQREAPERLAHILCELLLRLRAVGLADSNCYELPITQEELGDTLGLSTVHVNRTLQALRAANLITLKGGHVVILDPDRLFEFSGFNPNYLHLREAGARIKRSTPAA